MEITNKQVLKILYIFSCIIFIGVCIEACGFIFSTIYTLTINPVNAATFWERNDLSALYAFDHGHFVAEAIFIIIAAVLKAIMLYLIVRILHDKKLDMSSPFSEALKRFIISLSILAFGIGLFTAGGVKYTEWLVSKGIAMPDTQHLRLGGADVWLFMAVILFIIAQIFKKGIEIQSENELTV